MSRQPPAASCQLTAGSRGEPNGSGSALMNYFIYLVGLVVVVLAVLSLLGVL
jgi:hypothetical protein